MTEIFDFSNFKKKKEEKKLKPESRINFYGDFGEGPNAPKEKLDYEKLMELICLLNELVPVTSADQRRRIHGDLYKKIASYSSDEIIKIVNGWTRPEAESKALYYLMLLDVAGERGLIKTHFEE